MLTVLTQHWLVNYCYILEILYISNIILFGVLRAVLFDRVVTVNTQPVHLTTTTNLVTTYNWNVVLYVTSYDTSTTTCTSVQVDSHYPFVTWLLKFVPQIVSFVCISETTRFRVRIFLIFSEGSLTDDVTTFDSMVCLSLCYFVSS